MVKKLNACVGLGYVGPILSILLLRLYFRNQVVFVPRGLRYSLECWQALRSLFIRPWLLLCFCYQNGRLFYTRVPQPFFADCVQHKVQDFATQTVIEKKKTRGRGVILKGRCKSGQGNSYVNP